jgi:hypothetical protein
VQRVGYYWLFSATSRGFGYGYEAMRIRVNIQGTNPYVLLVCGISIIAT